MAINNYKKVRPALWGNKDLDSIPNKGGATADRPSSPVLYERFFDTTLGYPIWWDGTNWVDSSGTTV